ncbi:hypothetical protein PAMC26577_22975 [Caballeronia sordidicola]|uniref:Uncharacterized protein n=1 Tax=Caballeronia sordidicola TaxID=196367 RepID=A0A242MKJ9_CABSO|nr:hypothetical protein PAMC26577_22975 [Caballeronia sordidicola]
MRYRRQYGRRSVRAKRTGGQGGCNPKGSQGITHHDRPPFPASGVVGSW